MKTQKIITLCAVGMASGLSVNAATVTINNLDVRANGIFGHDPNISAVTVNGSVPGGTVTADPINITFTYSNLDLDGDSTANDSVTITLTATKFGTDGGALRIFNQGIDTGFGNLNDVSVTVSSVSGTTTDSGDAIVFDGFTGAAIGGGTGAGSDLDRSAEINGVVASIYAADNGAFRFATSEVNFAATPTVTFDNSAGTSGSVVARSYDLQFSTTPIPEPSSALLLGLSGGLLAIRRRK